jgi:hypothetical protein
MRMRKRRKWITQNLDARTVEASLMHLRNVMRTIIIFIQLTSKSKSFDNDLDRKYKKSSNQSLKNETLSLTKSDIEKSQKPKTIFRKDFEIHFLSIPIKTHSTTTTTFESIITIKETIIIIIKRATVTIIKNREVFNSLITINNNRLIKSK